MIWALSEPRRSDRCDGEQVWTCGPKGAVRCVSAADRRVLLRVRGSAIAGKAMQMSGTNRRVLTQHHGTPERRRGGVAMVAMVTWCKGRDGVLWCDVPSKSASRSSKMCVTRAVEMTAVKGCPRRQPLSGGSRREMMHGSRLVKAAEPVILGNTRQYRSGATQVGGEAWNAAGKGWSARSWASGSPAGDVSPIGAPSGYREPGIAIPSGAVIATAELILVNIGR